MKKLVCAIAMVLCWSACGVKGPPLPPEANDDLAKKTTGASGKTTGPSGKARGATGASQQQ